MVEMRTLLLVALLAVTRISAQDTAAVNLHLPAVELRKAAWNQNTAAWCFAFGSMFTYLASRPENIDEGEALAFGMGFLTLGLTTTFTLGAARHQRRAADAMDFSTHSGE